MARQNPTGEALAEALRPTLEPVVSGLGLVLEEVSVTPAGAQRVLRVVLDSIDDPAVADSSTPPGTLTLDAVAEASREISTVLDASDVMGSTPYVLEVSSPGVDRPLTTPRHFARNLRRLVAVTLTDRSTVQGRLVGVGDELELEVAGAKKGMTKQRSLAWDDVVSGQVQVEFRRPDDDGADDGVDDGVDDAADDAADDGPDDGSDDESGA